MKFTSLTKGFGPSDQRIPKITTCLQGGFAFDHLISHCRIVGLGLESFGFEGLLTMHMADARLKLSMPAFLLQCAEGKLVMLTIVNLKKLLNLRDECGFLSISSSCHFKALPRHHNLCLHSFLLLSETF